MNNKVDYHIPAVLLNVSSMFIGTFSCGWITSCITSSIDAICVSGGIGGICGIGLSAWIANKIGWYHIIRPCSSQEYMNIQMMDEYGQKRAKEFEYQTALQNYRLGYRLTYPEK